MASSSSDRGQPSGGAEVDWDSLMQLQEMLYNFRKVPEFKVKFPRLVVLGQQGHGKSSLLNKLVGYPLLPVGEGTCTKRPIRCVVKKRRAEQGDEDFVTFADGPHKGMIFSANGEPGSTLEDFRRLLREETAVCHDGVDFHEEELAVKLWMLDTLELEFVDLPGLIVNVMGKDLNEGRLERDKVERIAKKYCDKEAGNIIMLVCSGTEDSNNWAAYDFARSEGINGQGRTIGVITKLDSVDGSEITKRKKFESLKKQSVFQKTSNDLCEFFSIMSPENEEEEKIKEVDRILEDLEVNTFKQRGKEAFLSRLFQFLEEHFRHGIPTLWSSANQELQKIKDDLMNMPSLETSQERFIFLRDLKDALIPSFNIFLSKGFEPNVADLAAKASCLETLAKLREACSLENITKHISQTFMGRGVGKEANDLLNALAPNPTQEGRRIPLEDIVDYYCVPWAIDLSTCVDELVQQIFLSIRRALIPCIEESPRLKHVLSLKRHLVHRCESILKEECDSIVNIVKRLALSFETVDWNQDYELLAEAPPSSQAELRILIQHGERLTRHLGENYAKNLGHTIRKLILHSLQKVIKNRLGEIANLDLEREDIESLLSLNIETAERRKKKNILRRDYEELLKQLSEFRGDFK